MYKLPLSGSVGKADADGDVKNGELGDEQWSENGEWAPGENEWAPLFFVDPAEGTSRKPERKTIPWGLWLARPPAQQRSDDYIYSISAHLYSFAPLMNEMDWVVMTSLKNEWTTILQITFCAPKTKRADLLKPRF